MKIKNKQEQTQRRRNIAIGLILASLSIIFFIATFIKLSVNIANNII